MATLQPYFAKGTQQGSTEKVEVKVLFAWPPVGQGQFDTFGDFNASFNGQIKSVIYSGPLNLALSLSDQDASAQEGSATITLNDATDTQAAYKVQGNQLVISATLGGKLETIAIKAGDGGTYVTLSGAASQSVFLKPS